MENEMTRESIQDLIKAISAYKKEIKLDVQMLGYVLGKVNDDLTHVLELQSIILGIDTGEEAQKG